MRHPFRALGMVVAGLLSAASLVLPQASATDAPAHYVYCHRVDAYELRGCGGQPRVPATAAGRQLGWCSRCTTDWFALQVLAKEQTKLLTAFDRNTGVSPTRCGQGEGRDGVHDVFLLPVLASPDDPEPTTIRCVTTADEVFIDAGGAFVTEDAAGPSYPLPFPDGDLVPFDRAHLNAICDDAIEHYKVLVTRW